MSKVSGTPVTSMDEARKEKHQGPSYSARQFHVHAWIPPRFAEKQSIPHDTKVRGFAVQRVAGRAGSEALVSPPCMQANVVLEINLDPFAPSSLAGSSHVSGYFTCS